MKVIKFIGYLVTSFIMWIGWLPIIGWRIGAFNVYNSIAPYYTDNKIECVKMVFAFYKYLFTSDMMVDYGFPLLKRSFWGLVIYFVILIVLSFFRKATFGEFMENGGLNSKSDRLMFKQFEEEEKKAYSGLFKKETPADRQFSIQDDYPPVC